VSSPPVRRLAKLLALLLIAAPCHAQFKAPKQADVPFSATPQVVVDAMLDLAGVTAADIVYDLGSGDGRIPITAASRYGATGVGIEIDAMLIRRSLDNVRTSGVGDRVRFVNQDFFQADLSAATVVALFLYPGVNERLMPKLQRELQPGARIVSHRFDFGEQWRADQTRDVDGTMVYLWTIK
jgi:cyclopropane fatty-acyl-phospholipid synthase-like methyltransferase